MKVSFKWFLRRYARSFDVECMECMLRPRLLNKYKYKVCIDDSRSLYTRQILSKPPVVGDYCFDAQKELNEASSTLCLKKYWEF